MSKICLVRRFKTPAHQGEADHNERKRRLSGSWVGAALGLGTSLHQPPPAPGKPNASIGHRGPKMAMSTRSSIWSSAMVFLGNEGQRALSSTGNGENNSGDICFPSQLITMGLNEFLNKG